MEIFLKLGADENEESFGQEVKILKNFHIRFKDANQFSYQFDMDFKVAYKNVVEF